MWDVGTPLHWYTCTDTVRNCVRIWMTAGLFSWAQVMPFDMGMSLLRLLTTADHHLLHPTLMYGVLQYLHVKWICMWVHLTLLHLQGDVTSLHNWIQVMPWHDDVMVEAIDNRRLLPTFILYIYEVHQSSYMWSEYAWGCILTLYEVSEHHHMHWIHMWLVASLHCYTLKVRSNFCKFGLDLVSWDKVMPYKWHGDVAIEAVDHSRPLLKSILNIYEMFEQIHL